VSDVLVTRYEDVAHLILVALPARTLTYVRGAWDVLV
jgi:hypothetical protein